jgi:hypothetical protein
MLQVELRELQKKEYRLMYLIDLKTKVERTANCKTNRLDSLNKQILKLENLLEGEYETMRSIDLISRPSI